MAKFKPKNNEKKDRHYEVGISEVKISTLPSSGLSYPENFEISYRPYTWGEVKHISGSENLSPKDTTKYVLNGVNCSFNKMRITLSDFMYLGYLRKLSNNLAGKTITAILACPKCKIQDSYTIENSSIDFEEISCNQLPVKTTIGGRVMKFYPITIGDYLHMVEKQRGLDSVNQMAYMALNGDYEKYESTYNVIYEADVETGEALEEIESILYHGIKPVNVKCKCGNSISIELDSGITTDGGKVILRPFRESQNDVRSRISFGD